MWQVVYISVALNEGVISSESGFCLLSSLRAQGQETSSTLRTLKLFSS
jgi:hypothetical protein